MAHRTARLASFLALVVLFTAQSSCRPPARVDHDDGDVGHERAMGSMLRPSLILLAASVLVLALWGSNAAAAPPEQARVGSEDGQQLTVGSRELATVSVPEKPDVFELTVSKRGKELARHALDEGCGFHWSLLAPPGDRKEPIILMGRYCFYLLDHHAKNLHGPFHPTFHGEGSDSQSGMVADLRMLPKRSLLLGYCVDSGPFAFDLGDLSRPREIEPLFPEEFGDGAAVFPLPSGRRGRYDLLWLRQEGWGVVDAVVLEKGVEQESLSPDRVRELLEALPR